MDLFQDQWQRHCDLVESARNVLVQQLQLQTQVQVPLGEETSASSDLDDVALACCHWRNCNLLHDDEGDTNATNTNTNTNNADISRWKLLVDQALDMRDEQRGLGPGHFWGAQGECCVVRTHGAGWCRAPSYHK